MFLVAGCAEQGVADVASCASDGDDTGSAMSGALPFTNKALMTCEGYPRALPSRIRCPRHSVAGTQSQQALFTMIWRFVLGVSFGALVVQ